MVQNDPNFLKTILISGEIQVHNVNPLNKSAKNVCNNFQPQKKIQLTKSVSYVYADVEWDIASRKCSPACCNFCSSVP